MRVLLTASPGSWTHEGGHRTQVRETAAALRSRGHDAHVNFDDVEHGDPEDYDLVHVFDDPRWLLAAYPNSSRPLVVSPIWMPASFRYGPHHWSNRIVRRSRKRARWALERLRRPDLVARRRVDLRKHVAALCRADLIIANSHAELSLLRADAIRVGHRPPKGRVARSATRAVFTEGDPALGRSLAGVDRPFFLTVGRIEPGKNQLSVAEAAQHLGIPLVLVGQVLPGNEPYLAACREVNNRLVHIDFIPHRQLRHVYAAAVAHVLPSYFETTGLVTLEALRAGTPAVASDIPCVREYFEGHAHLVNPRSQRQLIAAMEATLGPAQPPTYPQLSWDATASVLERAYDHLLAGRSRREQGRTAPI